MISLAFSRSFSALFYVEICYLLPHHCQSRSRHRPRLVPIHRWSVMARTGRFHRGHFPPPHFWRRAAHGCGHVPLSLALLPHLQRSLWHHLSARQSDHLPTHFHCWQPQFVGCPHHYACRDAGDHPGGHDGAVLAGRHRRSLHRQIGRCYPRHQSDHHVPHCH